LSAPSLNALGVVGVTESAEIGAAGREILDLLQPLVVLNSGNIDVNFHLSALESRNNPTGDIA